MSDGLPVPLLGVYWVRPGQLLAGPYPSTSARINWLLEAGVTFFVDLTTPGEMKPYQSLIEGRAHHCRIPIEDFSVPDRETMRQILDTIDFALLKGAVVYVHCLAGIGRTGTVVGCYLVRHGSTGQEALDAVARWAGANSPETDEQRALVLSWCEG